MLSNKSQRQCQSPIWVKCHAASCHVFVLRDTHQNSPYFKRFWESWKIVLECNLSRPMFVKTGWMTVIALMIAFGKVHLIRLPAHNFHTCCHLLNKEDCGRSWLKCPHFLRYLDFMAQLSPKFMFHTATI